MLEAPTHEGSVLRVDMRLRPFGDSGPLVASFASFEDYLPRHGRDWERYAYVKARASRRRSAMRSSMPSAVRPFVYRRYLDYGVFESLREMKALIEREVERRELADHVKLGPGRHSRDRVHRAGIPADPRRAGPALADAIAVQALALLGSRNFCRRAWSRDLRAAYVFLRRLENRLQMLGDAQVHRLPEDALTRERIALAMGAPDWDALSSS